jgi:hypothetical protein
VNNFIALKYSKMKSINSEKTIVSLIEDNIIHIHLKSNMELDISDTQEILESMRLVSGGKKLPVFIDAGEFASIDDDVRVFSASKAGNIYTLADAIAVDNIAQKLIANFYLKNNHPKVPTKIFKNKSDALAWLREFTKK